MQHSPPPHHSIASTTDRFIQVGHFALHLHNPDESTSAFFQVSHCIFRINFFTASSCISSRFLVTIPQHYRVRALHFHRQPLPIPRQLTALPLRRVTLSACHFSDNSSSQPFHQQPFQPTNSFKLPLRYSFPVNHIPSQFPTTVSCIQFTASQTTDSIPVHNLLIRCVQLFNRSTIQ